MRWQSILLLFFLTLAACRHDVDVLPPPPPPIESPTFGISGDTAVEVVRARSVNAALFVTDSGAGQAVSLSISGLPPGVTAEIDSPGGTPSFYTTVHFRASVDDVAGSFSTAIVLAKQADGTEKSHSIGVTVLENPSCAELRAGEYAAGSCGGGGFISTVTADSALPNTRIRIKGFIQPDYSAYADLNCTDGTLVFPPQYFVYHASFSATGWYSNDTIRAYGTISSSGGTSPCSVQFIRQ